MSKFTGMTLGQKIEHFWFYYKWHTIGALFAAFALTVCLVQCSMEEKADTTIGLYMDRQFTGSETDLLADVLSEYCEDTNGDGEVVVKIYDYSYLEIQQDQLKQLNKEKIMTELTGGTCVMYITDDYQQKFFDEKDIPLETQYGKYVSLSEENEILKKLTEKGFKNPQDLLFLIRKTENTVFETTNGKDKVETLLKNPQKILEAAAK
ncbi:MAG: hypothetical protein IJ462_02110 [Clostridia bacterium]|nr:hypothetical protein [Clostridia bacterium]